MEITDFNHVDEQRTPRDGRCVRVSVVRMAGTGSGATGGAYRVRGESGITGFGSTSRFGRRSAGRSAGRSGRRSTGRSLGLACCKPARAPSPASDFFRFDVKAGKLLQTPLGRQKSVYVIQWLWHCS